MELQVQKARKKIQALLDKVGHGELKFKNLKGDIGVAKLKRAKLLERLEKARKRNEKSDKESKEVKDAEDEIAALEKQLKVVSKELSTTRSLRLS